MPSVFSMCSRWLLVALLLAGCGSSSETQETVIAEQRARDIAHEFMQSNGLNPPSRPAYAGFYITPENRCLTLNRSRAPESRKDLDGLKESLDRKKYYLVMYEAGRAAVFGGYYCVFVDASAGEVLGHTGL